MGIKITSLAVDEELWIRVKTYAASKGITISKLAQTLFEKELKKQV